MNLVYSVFIILISTLTICQAQIEKVPELRVWYEAKNLHFGKLMSYLPDFDTARTQSAVAIFQWPGFTRTWYNLYQNDTTDYFTWKDAANGRIIPIDLNDDGIRDYYTCSGAVYKGVANGRPPLDTPSSSVNEYFFLPPFVADFNADSVQDMIFPSSDQPIARDPKSRLGYIVLGNRVLDSIRSVSLPVLDDDYQQLVGAFVGEDGAPRILALVFSPLDHEGNIVLYKLQLDRKANNYSIKYEILAEYVNHFNSQVDMASGVSFFNAADTKEHTVVWGRNVYAIDDAHIQFLRVTVMNGCGWVVSNNCNVDSIVCISSIHETDSLGRSNPQWSVIWQANPRVEHLAFAKVPFGWKVENNGGVSIEMMVAVGDVNHDGIMDFAAYYSGIDDFDNISRFRIYLGQGQTSGIDSSECLTQNIEVFPNLLPRSASVYIRYLGEFTNNMKVQLYDLRGRVVATLYDNPIEDNSTIELELRTLHLAAGIYNLRCSCGTQTVDKALIVE